MALEYIFRRLILLCFMLLLLSIFTFSLSFLFPGDPLNNLSGVQNISFHESDALSEKYGDPEVGRLDWKPTTPTEVDKEGAEKILRFIDTLEDNDDVQLVTTNADIPDEILAELED